MPPAVPPSALLPSTASPSRVAPMADPPPAAIDSVEQGGRAWPGRSKPGTWIAFALGLLLGAAPASAMASANAACPPPSAPDALSTPTEQLRAASLDLRGTTPTMQEYDDLLAAVAAGNDPQAALGGFIKGWLSSLDFADQLVRLHRDKLWNAIDNFRLLHVPGAVAQSGNVYWRNGGNVAVHWRGNRVPCLDEPATWDEDGQIIFKPQPDGTKREGFVMVAPYWAPTTQIKVCAVDAQDTVTSASGKFCGALGMGYEAGCGCGPNMRWCRYGDTDGQILRSFSTALDRQIRDVLAEDRPYTDLFTEKVAWINGPIAFFWRHQAQVSTPLRLSPVPLDVNTLPDLPFAAMDTWVKIELPKAHAGILSAPAFLLRFQTNRARGNRFYSAFLCQPFQAPDTGIPVDAAAALAEPDLQLRAGCKYCHGLLEPVAAFWGRWVENGAAYLDPMGFPPFHSGCDTCAKTGNLCTPECKLFYNTKALSDKEKTFLGWLEAYTFLASAHQKHIDQGPKLMALTAAVDQRLPRCVARRTAEWLLGRELVDEEELAWTDTLAVEFAQGGFKMRSLVATIVASDVYRRVR